VVLIGVFLVLVSGVLVSGGSTIARCLGWPFGFPEPIPVGGAERAGWPLLLRNIAAGVVSILVGVFIVQTWRTPATRPELDWIATITGLSFLVELLVGALISTQGENTFLLVAYVVAVVALWVLLVIATVLTAMPPAIPAVSSLNKSA
jgi:heme A synthase